VVDQAALQAAELDPIRGLFLGLRYRDIQVQMVLHMTDMLLLVEGVEQGALVHAVFMVLTVMDGQQVHHQVEMEALV
jgi:hypothetical protein